MLLRCLHSTCSAPSAAHAAGHLARPRTQLQPAVKHARCRTCSVRATRLDGLFSARKAAGGAGGKSRQSAAGLVSTSAAEHRMPVRHTWSCRRKV